MEAGSVLVRVTRGCPKRHSEPASQSTGWRAAHSRVSDCAAELKGAIVEGDMLPAPALGNAES